LSLIMFPSPSGHQENAENGSDFGVICELLDSLLETVSICEAARDSRPAKIDDGLFVIDNAGGFRETILSSSDDEESDNESETMENSSIGNGSKVFITSDSDSEAEFDRIMKTAREQRKTDDSDLRPGSSIVPKTDGNDLRPGSSIVPRPKNFRQKKKGKEIELPLIEKLSIRADYDIQLVKLGAVQNLIEELAVIQSDFGIPPLDADTVLFDASRNAIGTVFEVFGPVTRPCYTIRFNSPEDLQDSSLCKGIAVFFAPARNDWTRSVFTDALLKMRGTDGRYPDDPAISGDEPEDEFFSDDEAERQAKKGGSSRPFGPFGGGAIAEPSDHGNFRGRGRPGGARRGRFGRGRGRNGFPFHSGGAITGPSDHGNFRGRGRPYSIAGPRFPSNDPNRPPSFRPNQPGQNFAYPPPPLPAHFAAQSQQQFGQVSWANRGGRAANSNVNQPGPSWRGGSSNLPPNVNQPGQSWRGGSSNWPPSNPMGLNAQNAAAARQMRRHPPRKNPRMDDQFPVEFVDRRLMDG